MPQPYPNGELVIVIDCSDLDRSARFWAAVLGYEAGPDATGPYRGLTPARGSGSTCCCSGCPPCSATTSAASPVACIAALRR